MIYFIGLCLVFFAGFFLRGVDPLMDYLGISTLTPETQTSNKDEVSSDPYNSVSARVAEVQGLLESNSFSSDYDLDKVTSSVLSSYAGATGDTYVRYYSKEEYAKFQQDNSRNYYGIGVLFGSLDNCAYVAEVFDESPAQASGVQVGDSLVAINGQRKENGWTLTDAIHAIDAAEGQHITVTWRCGEKWESKAGEEYETSLVCYQAEEKNVSSKMVDGVGYIKISQLGRSTSTYVADAIDELRKKGAEGFVLDLRSVPGGYLTQAVEVVSLFQKSGNVVQIETKSGSTSKLVSGNVVATEPLTVLVNKHTAAAAEVVAASLQEDSRATIVGETTMGKGSVQVVKELSFGGAVSYTAAYYKTPRGRDIEGVGVEPTYAVSNTGTTDSQLNRAVSSVLAQLGQ